MSCDRLPIPAARLLLAGALALLAAASFHTVALAAGTAPDCLPRTLNVSRALAGGALSVSPTPDSADASHLTQLSFVGVPAAAIEHLHVSGSRSGAHPGRLAAYSQGDGASFLPARPFAQGETVTVRGMLRRGAGAGSGIPFAWRFTVAEVDAVSRSLETPPPPPPPPRWSELQHFVSRSDLRPPAVTVTVGGSRGQGAGDIFLAPYAGPGQYGPMILDGAGRLLWFKAVPAGSRAADLRVQSYEGRPVLTWWQAPLVAGGRRDAGVVIADGSYENVAIVRAGNGYQPDLHAFEITPQGTALYTVYDAIRCNLSAHGGPADGALADTLVQEIDLRTGLVRSEWHALDHVALADSYMPVGGGGTPVSPWDYFHINSVSQYGGELLVDSRNTWAAYDIDARTGRIAWRLGGRHSSFALPAGAAPAWQHDARRQPDGSISFFDNGGTPRVRSQSRVTVLALDARTKRARLVSSFVHSAPLMAASQGDFQPLYGGNWFVGWGQEPFFSEYSPAGRLLFDAHLPRLYQSYTALSFPWAGAPRQPPSLAVRAAAHGRLIAYVSWNGATAVTQWRLLGGASPHALGTLATAPRKGFETAIALPKASPRYLAIQALDADGHVLGASLPVALGGIVR
jgi:hypothetical protein